MCASTKIASKNVPRYPHLKVALQDWFDLSYKQQSDMKTPETRHFEKCFDFIYGFHESGVNVFPIDDSEDDYFDTTDRRWSKPDYFQKDVYLGDLKLIKAFPDGNHNFFSNNI